MLRVARARVCSAGHLQHPHTCALAPGGLAGSRPPCPAWPSWPEQPEQPARAGHGVRAGEGRAGLGTMGMRVLRSIGET